MHAVTGEGSGRWLSDLAPGISRRDLVALAKIRRRIEHDYRELRGGPDLDHFEDRGHAD